MFMFLTRLGENSRAVITGDPSQIDLKDPRWSGLREAIQVLGDVDSVRFVKFDGRDVVRHPGSVVILALDSRRRVLLERQYRHAAGQRLWELPAGRIDPGEKPLAAAKRELLEETGYSARHWKKALFYYASPGFLDETMAIYMASGLREGQAQPEEDELIQIRLFSLPAALRMVMNGSIQDGKTIAGVLWLNQSTSGRSS